MEAPVLRQGLTSVTRPASTTVKAATLLAPRMRRAASRLKYDIRSEGKANILSDEDEDWQTNDLVTLKTCQGISRPFE